MKTKYPVLVALALCIFSATAAPPVNYSSIHVAPQPESPVKVVPNNNDWLYEPGQPASFRVTVALTPYPAEGVSVKYRIGPEKYEGEEKTITVPAEGITLEAGTRSEPGITRCIVTTMMDGVKKRATAAAVFDAGKITVTSNEPEDFDAFWTAQKAGLERLPLQPEVTHAPHLSTPEVEVSYVSVKNISGRFYGLLSVPRGPGPYPAALLLPGGGVWRRGGETGAKNDLAPDIALAKRGVIVLQCGVHGIPLNFAPEVYTALQSGPLAGYFNINSDDRERHYFRRVILGCIRANDYLVSLPKWDGKNLITKGGSQGGMLSIMTAVLDPRVSAVAPFFPSSPGIKPPADSPEAKAAAARLAGLAAAAAVDPGAPKFPASDYYSTINFAKRLKAPGFYAWGYNDEGCYPTMTLGLYNLITAPKQLLVALEGGHGSSPEQKSLGDEWIAKQRMTPP